MRFERFEQSPLAIASLAFASLVGWTLVFDALAPPLAAADENTSVDAALVSGAAAITTAPTIVARVGPRLRRAPDPEVLGLDIAIEDANGRSMARLHEALRRAERGEGQARLVFYGASHTASDLFTHHIRTTLQARFGDAGHGVVLPAHPWHTYRHFGVEVESSRGRWAASKVMPSDPAIDHYGVHGVFVEADQINTYGKVRTAEQGEVGHHASLFDVYYLKRPDGGSFDVEIDGRGLGRIDTSSDTVAAGYATYRVPDGPHELQIRIVGDGPVRLFGVAVEREAPGVIVDTLGVNGARARYQLQWEDSLYREHLRRRQPDLVALAYGTNEAGDDTPISDYEDELRRVVGRIRETVPEASCLLIGPSDRPVRRPDRTYVDRRRTAEVIEVQHRVAIDNGCGFFDLVAYMGGPLSMVEWVNHNPPYGAPDHVHYNRRGYHRLGEVLLGALIDAYDPDLPELAPEDAPRHAQR